MFLQLIKPAPRPECRRPSAGERRQPVSLHATPDRRARRDGVAQPLPPVGLTVRGVAVFDHQRDPQSDHSFFSGYGPNAQPNAGIPQWTTLPSGAPFVYPDQLPELQLVPPGGTVQATNWDHLIYAYLIENTRIFDIFERLLETYAFSEDLETPSPAGQLFWRTTRIPSLRRRDPLAAPHHVEPRAPRRGRQPSDRLQLDVRDRPLPRRGVGEGASLPQARGVEP